MTIPLRKWLQVCFINLMLVAFIGIVLRYKIAWSLPFVDQKYLLHGHSHFAFAGWISQVLMVLLVAWLGSQNNTNCFSSYRLLLYTNLLAAYGMLFTFPLQGYGAFSIAFSTLSIVVSYFFAVRFSKDLNRLATVSTAHKWFKAAVFFNALSSLGVFTLAFMMATKNIHPHVYLGAVYFYLHFQYNGWFFFACMGLLSGQLVKFGAADKKLLQVYRLFAGACIPACLLSLLWIAIPAWAYVLTVLAVAMQLGGWWMAVSILRSLPSAHSGQIPVTAKRLFLLSGIALTIKLLLQAASVIPSVSKLAFGFRPVVIGYLHLVLLGIITLFIMAYTLALLYIRATKMVVSGVVIFVGGIIFNEILLMLQGVADLSNQGLPFINPLLLAAAVTMFAGLGVLNAGIAKQQANPGKSRQNKAFIRTAV